MSDAGFAARAAECAGLFRVGRDVEAALEMVDLFSALAPSFARVSPALQQGWAHLLGVMFGCQERQDWLGLADYLEYDLLELLGHARGV